MIAMPFHPSNTYTIEELNANLDDILCDVEKKAQVSLDGAVNYSLHDKVRNGKFHVDQGIIAGCAGGGFENICAAADILKGQYIGADEFTLSVYPASMPIYICLLYTSVDGSASDGNQIINIFLKLLHHLSHCDFVGMEIGRIENDFLISGRM